MEVYRAIKDHEGSYEVSNLGNVRSLDRVVKHWRGNDKKLKGFVLTPVCSIKGYQRIELSQEGLRKIFLVHRLVAEAFLPNPENKSEVNHKNGIKSDNRAENLEWCTASENIHHAFDTGLKVMTKGEDCTWAKLTESQVRKIKFEHKGMLVREIAELYKVSKSRISMIRSGKAWAHITE